jgi:hypothetical protein
MARISKKQSMFNALISNVVRAEYEYSQGQLSLETLLYVYGQNRLLATKFFGDLFRAEWYEYAVMRRIDEILSATSIKVLDL